MRVLVLGGYGNFGARIVRALAGDARIDVVVCGRDLQRARQWADATGSGALALDVAAEGLADAFVREGAGLVIHTAGPFQGQDYRVARAAAAAGAHYIDLADGRRFVCDFQPAVDEMFRRAGRLAVTGASSVPGLSSAVVDAALARFARLDAVRTCIAPGQRAPRGKATLEGVLSYCGAPVRVWRDGGWRDEPGWCSPEPVRFARLKSRRGALCDIPDLELFPARYAPVREVEFRAALEVPFTQWVFATVGRARRWGLVPKPERLAGFFHATGTWADAFGSGDGGMVVRVAGQDEAQRPIEAAWHLTAPGGHGPEIPCMPAILLARRLAAGTLDAIGATPCMGLLRIDDFQQEFARWGMTAEWDGFGPAGQPA